MQRRTIIGWPRTSWRRAVRRVGQRAGLSLVVLTVAAGALLSACSSDDDSATSFAPGFEGALAVDGDDGASRGAFDQKGVGAPSMVAVDSSAEAAPPAFPGASQVDLLGRTIIRSGTVSMEVESVSDAFDAVRAVATANGGFVADSGFSGSAEHASARLTLRVPAERFDHVVSELRSLAVEVTAVRTSTQDITEEFSDLEAQLRNLRAVEAQYLELLGRTGTIGDVLQVQDRLNQTRLQIERAQGRIQLLEGLAALATLSVELNPLPVEPVVANGGGGPIEAAGEAWDASLATLSTIATVAVVVVVYSWWLVPVLVLLALIGRRLGRRLPTARGSGQDEAPAVVDSPEGTA